MNYVVVSGAFKDVYSPVEACDMIRELLSDQNEVKTIPFCDGGEYTYDVLLAQGGYKQVTVENVVGPYLQLENAKYLTFGKEAHIISSQILRLLPWEDEQKNPLKLTDYGYGQMVKHAIDHGYKKIFLYWGGTSTVGFGLGFAQALGVKFYDKDDVLIRTPINTEKIFDITRMEGARGKYENVEVKVIVDGNARLYEIKKIAELKIGEKYKNCAENILNRIDECINKIALLFNASGNEAYAGAAGGLLFGTELCFQPQYCLGGVYFEELLHISEQISSSDCVITGEGRYDNTACGKTPVFVARIAKKYNKKVLFVCGQVNKSILPYYAGGIIQASNCKELYENGIDMLITCQEFYDNEPPDGSYEEHVKYFKDHTASVLKKIVQKQLYDQERK